MQQSTLPLALLAMQQSTILPLVTSTTQQLCTLRYLFLLLSRSLCSLQGCVESQLLRRTHLVTVGSLSVSFTANRDISVHDWSFLFGFPSRFCAALDSVIN
jgi:hypothetical protein